ncbi:hypothetical protein SAMN03159423_4504 [Bradyrhizobium sp. NFR13]|uniref:hypothetical protein n=1 Tax=Bradyrhizobium sp. NFR13 TaxID=1566285 RepID=UPI0008DF22DF|nr:hypothetical protein [Bradyrhizobium sp. NFR13]SFL93507.1 hypothetical protein SAMN03159423_4504 [Bradyrhizobium sp. NFR13]
MSEKSEIRSETMSELLLSEASSLLREVAGDRRADESKKAVLRRVGREVQDWTASRIKDVWYRDRRVRIRAYEVEYLRALVSRRQEQKAEVNELEALRDRVSRIERLLGATDPAFHSPSIAAARQQLSEMAGEPRVVDRSNT